MKAMTRREFGKWLGAALLPAWWLSRPGEQKKAADAVGNGLVLVNDWVLLESDLPRGNSL